MRFSYAAFLMSYFTALNTYGEESCAIVSFIPEKSSKSVELLSVNQVRVVDVLKKSRAKAALESEYTLPAGDYDISYILWDKKLLKRGFRNRYIAYETFFNSYDSEVKKHENSMSEVGYAVISLKANFHYKYALQQNGNGGYALKEISKETIDCKVDNTFVGKKGNLNADRKVHVMNIPAQVEMPMRRLMLELKRYHDDNNLSLSNTITAYANDELGITLDKSFNGKGIRLLTVTPYSVAQDIGFRSGDILTHIQGKLIDKQAFIKQLSYYLLEAGVLGELDFTLKRRGDITQIKKPFLPTIYPSISYNLANTNNESGNVVNNSKLPKGLEASLERMVNTLLDSFNNRDDLSDIDIIQFNAPPVLDISLGAFGNISKLPNGSYAFEIDAVNENSMADKAGIKVGDKLIGVNNKQFSSENLTTLDQVIKSLQPNDTFSLNVLENSEPQSRTVTYEPTKLPGFTFSLDLKSQYRMVAMLSKHTYSDYAKLKKKRLGTIYHYNSRYLRTGIYRRDDRPSLTDRTSSRSTDSSVTGSSAGNQSKGN
ncbi:PDZ domain-containing protein [Thalassotalea sp. PP2-459]|uniref:PDZ domain-containing protein n=1 Tax=Thalassotalea sp. PP2-459 TaxID=1742724 RepID=UPI000943A8C1|nr:PDZ domain-containing protein [Thalassotalea sp. PP2-459]OKY27633.1 hypothetical protein BI291_08645 [Thalassotalea sp. PP2-459]